MHPITKMNVSKIKMYYLAVKYTHTADTTKIAVLTGQPC